MSNNFDERIWKLEARVLIQEAHNKYAQGMIQRNENIFMSIWDRNAFWDMGSYGTATGLEAINKLWDKISPKPPFPSPNPMMCNTVVDFKDDGTVAALCYNFAVSAKGNGEGKVSFGLYHDHFTWKDDKWLLTSRTFERIYTAKLNDIAFD